MKVDEYNNKKLEAGDIVVCKGIRAEIAEITFQEYWGEKEGFYTEFRDTNRIYRNWKQWTDGGYVIPKAEDITQSPVNIQSPDKTVSVADMHEYGYGWSGMLPLTKNKAEELFGQDITIYKLYTDGSESTIEDSKELLQHDGLFGVEKLEWERVTNCRDNDLAETHLKTMCESLKTKEKGINIER